MPNTPLKIAIVAHSLAHGGAERSSALLSELLAARGYAVHVITIIDAVEYKYAGKLFNLGKLKNQDDSTFGRFKRLLALKNYLKVHDFDWIIDNRTRQSWWSEWVISRWLYLPKKSIYVVRSANIKDYFPTNNLIARHIYRKSPYIIAVSDGIKQAVEKRYGYKNVIRIYNALSLDGSAANADKIYSDRYIISYGRIDDAVKNYTLLISAYSKSGLIDLGIKLYILGDGRDTVMLRDKVAVMQLSENVIFISRVPHPEQYVKSALFTVLSSRYEGFPRVLIESLQCGIPVVSVDCVSGPSEIVQNEKNGLLVKNNDEQALAQALYRLATDAELYDICKHNARASVSHLSSEAIAMQWQQILSVQ